MLQQDISLQEKVNVLTKQKGIAKITACSLIGLMPAWVAVMYDQKFKQIYNRLTGRGKPPKVAIVAVMRKMIIEANKNLKFYYKNIQKNY